MASSSQAITSSVSSLRPCSYDVFISFRGVDTRQNFVSLLYDALKRDGIHAFIDSEELWEGEEILPSLLSAIRGSKISIPVFSQHYADSKYCLLELAQIWESHLSEGQTILPIFIGVEPRDVRHQTGSFQEPFKEHQSKCDSARVESWKNALTEVGNLKGWTLKGDATIKEQSNIVELVVQRAVRELGSNPLDEEKHLIGIDSHVKELLHLLHYGSDDVRFVGICGMGGLGKTTIAKAIYNRIFRSFNGSSFLTDVREEASQGNKGLVSLQKRLLHDMFKSDYDIGIVSQGSKLIAERLHREKILLILDDVNDYKQLDALVGGFNWFGQGSKVIITTRDVHILNIHKEKVGQDIQIYMPTELDFKNSLLLFSLHAFSKNEPSEHYKQLSNEVVNYTGGLPLSLEVLGSFLIDKDKKEWEDTLEILKDIGNDNNLFGRSIKAYDDRVFEKLMISYNQLGYREKTIFLDVACYFSGWSKEKAISLWEACELHPRLAIKELIQKHLLKIDASIFGDGCLKMHDQLQAMGRRIVLEHSYGDPARRSRLWSQDEIWKVLKKDTGTQMVEGMLIQKFEVKTEDEFVSEDDEFEAEDVLSGEAFQKMPNLRFLQLDEIGSFNGEFAHLPSKLRWFCWRGMKVLPPDFYHAELVHLDLSCEYLQQSWNDPAQNKKKRFQKLKVLNLCDYLEVSLPPDFFLWFPCLQRLNLYQCLGLLELPDSICRLASLKTITVSGCSSFRKLPTSIGNLRHLVELCLHDTRIQELPDGVGKLEKLEKLVVSRHGWDRKLLKLPASMGRMKSLRHFNLTVKQIEKLPDDFSNPLSLEVFIMAIQSWPPSFKSLPELPSTLTHLQLEDCISLPRISVQSHLERLEELSLRRCKSLVELPDLSNLRRLRKLDISNCENLEELPSLKGTESLEELNALCCYKLRELPDLSKLKQLRELKISACKNLGKIHGLEGTESLEVLDASHCRTLTELQDLSNLRRLRELWISRCKNLEKIHGLKGAESLEILLAISCPKLTELPDLSKLKKLRELKISACENLGKIHGLEGTESLEVLDASDCRTLTELQDLSNLRRLRELCISRCENLEKIHGLEGAESLEILLAISCRKLTIPDLSKLKRLRKLSVRFCQNIKKIQTESLEELDASFCSKLKELSNLSKLKRLRRLNIQNCANLDEIHGLTKSLEMLDVSFSSKLKKLPDLSKLKRLRKLNIQNCKNLEKIHGLTESLEKLDASFCSKLKELPDLSKLKRLRRLNIQNCANLEEIHGLTESEFLDELDASFCYKLKELPNLSKLKRLRKINIQNCENLEEIHGLTESLEELDASFCSKLKGLPDSSKLKRLIKLNIQNCANLEEIHGLTESEFLDELDVSFCSKLKELPDLSKLKRLRKLNIQNCENLEEIHGLTESLEELDMSNMKGLRKLNIGCDKNLEKTHGLQATESLEDLDASSSYKLRRLKLRCCENLDEIHGLDRTESLIVLNMRSCFKITETTRKILGQGTLVDDHVGQMQGINGSPILCVVFAFTPLELTQLQAGELGTISLEIKAFIHRGEIRIMCLHSIRIEDIKFTSQDIIYIHYFKGFDWFGFPLESKDAISPVSVKIRTISDAYKDNIFCPRMCIVKLVKVLFENKESNRDIPNQQSSAKLVAEFFRWSDADDAEEVEEKGALRASSYEGVWLDEDDNDADDEDTEESKVESQISLSKYTEEAEEETYHSEDTEEEEVMDNFCVGRMRRGITQLQRCGKRKRS